MCSWAVALSVCGKLAVVVSATPLTHRVAVFAASIVTARWYHLLADVAGKVVVLVIMPAPVFS